jgi:hypothetical protein
VAVTVCCLVLAVGFLQSQLLGVTQQLSKDLKAGANLLLFAIVFTPIHLFE